MITIEIPPLTLRIGQAVREHVGAPAHDSSLGKVTGSALFGLVTGPGGINIDVGLVTWPDGVRELKTMSTNASPPMVGYIPTSVHPK